MAMNKTDGEDIKLFFKYAIFVPVILTIFLQWLQFAGKLNLPWYWVFSPIWIWIGGAFQFLIGGIITEFFEGKK